MSVRPSQRCEADNIAHKVLEKAPMTRSSYIIAWHGTTKANAQAIIKSGVFRRGTWFARDMQVAARMGGTRLFAVRLDRTKWPKTDDGKPDWQAHTAEELKIHDVAVGFFRLQCVIAWKPDICQYYDDSERATMKPKTSRLVQVRIISREKAKFRPVESHFVETDPPGRKLSPIRDPETWEYHVDDECWTWLDMVVWRDVNGVWMLDCDGAKPFRRYGYDPSGKWWMHNDPECRWPVRLLKRFTKLYPKGRVE